MKVQKTLHSRTVSCLPWGKITLPTVLCILWMMGSGCSSILVDKARYYQNRGRPDIALEYWVAQYHQTSGRQDRQRLLKTIQKVYKQNLKKLSLKIEQTQAKDPLKAYEYLVQQRELAQWMSHVQLKVINQTSLLKKQKHLEKLLFKKLLKKFDRLEAQNKPDYLLLKTIRPLLALRPNNEELNRRYEAIKKRMSIQVSLVHRCSRKFAPLCDRALYGLADTLTHQSNEILHLLPPSAPLAPIRLILDLRSQASSTPWQGMGSNTVEARIPRYNSKKQVIKTRKGIKTQRVQAQYECFTKAHRVKVQGELILEDLRSNRKHSSRTQDQKSKKVKKKSKAEITLNQFSSQHSSSLESIASYIQWKGDERALNPNSEDSSLGGALIGAAFSGLAQSVTDEHSCVSLKAQLYDEITQFASIPKNEKSVMSQQPPLSLDLLTRTAWQSVIKKLSEDLNSHLNHFLEQE